MDALHDPLAWLQAHAEAATAPDPVRLRVLQGLARRAAAQTGPLRERLVARLLQRAAAETVARPLALPARPPGPLSLLVAELPTLPELRSVAAHRRTWGQLRVQRRLAEVSAAVPDHLGPLNSQVLMARALQQVQALSPDYLQCLLTQLDGLAALAPLQAAAEAGSARPARPGARKPPARTR